MPGILSLAATGWAFAAGCLNSQPGIFSVDWSGFWQPTTASTTATRTIPRRRPIRHLREGPSAHTRRMGLPKRLPCYHAGSLTGRSRHPHVAGQGGFQVAGDAAADDELVVVQPAADGRADVELVGDDGRHGAVDQFERGE